MGAGFVCGMGCAAWGGVAASLTDVSFLQSVLWACACKACAESLALRDARFPSGVYKPLCYQMWPYKVNGGCGGRWLAFLRALWPLSAGRSHRGRGLHVCVRPASPAAAALLVALGGGAVGEGALVAAQGPVEVEVAEVGPSRGQGWVGG